MRAELASLFRAEIAAGINDSIGEQISELRRFLDRRVAELSAEIHASVTLNEMSEASLTAQINRVQQEVAAMVRAPMADSRSSGIELEAVVQGTEDAANQIMEAAEAIQDWIGKGVSNEAADDIGQKVQAIFEACSFQDLTSQRIRRAIRHLQQVDTMLNSIAAPPAARVPDMVPTGPGGSGPDLDQGLIDQLMSF
jgi:chemotaxis protein CheZ